MYLPHSILLTIALAILPIESSSQTTSLSGYLINYKGSFKKEEVHVVLNWNPNHPVGIEDSSKNYHRINSSTPTSYDIVVDSEGNFQFNNLREGWVDLTFYRIGYQDYYSIHTFLIGSGNYIQLKVDYPRKEGQKSNKSCPLCKKRDQVVPIIYGLTSFAMQKKSQKQKIQLGGLIYSTNSPDWFCKRDNLYY